MAKKPFVTMDYIVFFLKNQTLNFRFYQVFKNQNENHSHFHYNNIIAKKSINHSHQLLIIDNKIQENQKAKQGFLHFECGSPCFAVSIFFREV